MPSAGGSPRSAVWIAADLDRRLQACREPVATLQQLGEAMRRETEELGVREVEAALDALHAACSELSFAPASTGASWSAWLLLEPPEPRDGPELAALRSCYAHLEVQLDGFLLRYDRIRIADREAAAEFNFEAGGLQKQVDKACGELQLLYEDLQQKYAHATAAPAFEALDRLRAHARTLSQTLHELDAICNLAAAVQLAAGRTTHTRVQVLEVLQRQLPVACQRLLELAEQLGAGLAGGAGRLRAAEDARGELLAQLVAARAAIFDLHASQHALEAALAALRRHVAAAMDCATA